MSPKRDTEQIMLCSKRKGTGALVEAPVPNGTFQFRSEQGSVCPTSIPTSCLLSKEALNRCADEVRP